MDEIFIITNPTDSSGNPMPSWEGVRVKILSGRGTGSNPHYQLSAVDGRPDGNSTDPFGWTCYKSCKLVPEPVPISAEDMTYLYQSFGYDPEEGSA